MDFVHVHHVAVGTVEYSLTGLGPWEGQVGGTLHLCVHVCKAYVLLNLNTLHNHGDQSYTQTVCVYLYVCVCP